MITITTTTKTMATQKPQIVFYGTDELNTLLKAEAKSLDISVSQLLRNIVKAHYNIKPNTPE